MNTVQRSFDQRRRIADPLLVLVLLLAFAFPLLGNFLEYHGHSRHALANPFEVREAISWPAGSMTVFANLTMLAIIGGVVIIGFGRIPPRELGLSWRNVAIGGAALPVAWCVLALAEAAMGVAGSGFALNLTWRSPTGLGVAAGNLMGQILGNAPYEELVFRAFLIPQVYLRWPSSSSAIRLVGALVVSQAFFGLTHVGTRVFKGHLDGLELFVSLVQVSVYGLAFAWIYLRTLNPFVAAAFHALSNYPEPIYYSARDLFPNETWLAYLLAAICFGALFPLLQRRGLRPELTPNG